ncbi:leucyl aminopeptidase family protein [Solwaraspora sp. WMMD1047]|uniref:leucyl aminopeptidase family protein n=1 Tax=Solwaraspora sp. WMMD1047 TaxID=3016102 RepID=UPI002416BCA0|nr:leucyl aminopeptidase family protein [Solwaraspora sp. WMMD1047]MDG4833540.1 leucyl aminopeptidase family protein [Solwaraspora sp. WMMD1047]
MLDIRLVTGPIDDTAALALPVRPAGPAAATDPAAGADAADGSASEADAAAGRGDGRLVPTALAVPAELLAEAGALVPLVPHHGTAGKVHLALRPASEPNRLLLFGIGAGDEAGWRAAGAGLARAAAREISITIGLPADPPAEAVRGLAEGLWLASYRFRAPAGPGDPAAAGEAEPASGRLAEVALVVADPAAHGPALAEARAVTEATRFARDLTNTPSSVKTPAWLAEQIVTAAAGRDGLTVTVRGPDELAEAGFGGMLAVGGGSAHGPRLVECGWSPADARTHVVLVGKGITFDTGGISIKPTGAMKLMRKDMGGAAAVLAATIGAAALRLPVRITALAPLAENMVSGSAYRPGDVIRHYGGLTSESTNTDAEGRLVLADALAYAVDRLAPDLLVDLATLTGANAVALGKRTAALYAENDDLAAALLAAAASTGERAWRLPLPGDYVEYLGSEVADLYSAPNQGGGSILAALYLREFAGDLRDRWAHIDMSAPSWADGDDAELVKGATGWGVRILLRWLATL